MAQGSPICFGDIIKLSAKSAFAEADGVVALSFMEQPGKDQPLLVVPPKDPASGVTLVEAEFIVAPVRGEKQQPNGTQLTYKTPFTLRTNETDKKKGEEVFYSLNNKVSGHKDGVTLQQALVKGEMYLTLEKEGYTAETMVHEHDAEFQVVVVDSNRIRKSLNHPLAHFVKPKAVGAFVGCGVTKSSKPLLFSVAKLSKTGNKTHSFMKDAKYRRASMEGLLSAKEDEASRPECADSDASESRHASIVSQASTSVLSAPGSPPADATPATTPSSVEATTGSTPATTSVSEPVERSVASEREAEHSTAVVAEVTTMAAHEAPAASVETPAAVVEAEAAVDGSVAAVEALPTSDPATETAVKTETAPLKLAETTSTAEVVISEAFTSASEAPAPHTMTTVSSAAVDADELDADVGNGKATCVGGINCSIM